jgi:hypothetical protein
VHHEPAALDRQIQAGLVFGRRCALLIQEGRVDLLDMDAADANRSTAPSIVVSD